MTRALLGLSFDNLGEAAEIELGALAPDAPQVGSHRTATETVPWLLARLAARGLAATFFVEGLNAELYPELLKEIDGAGHEVAFHAWRHEDWGRLDREEQAENLARGAEAFAWLGLRIAGMRPPGGQLGAGGTSVLADAGLAYASPAGSGAGVEEGIALLPFSWQHVDASCQLPPLAPVRERISGSPDPIEPGAFVDHLGRELNDLCERGGFMTVVLHPIWLDLWLGEGPMEAMLDAVASCMARGLEVLPMRAIAERVLAEPDDFGAIELDPSGWA